MKNAILSACVLFALNLCAQTSPQQTTDPVKRSFYFGLTADGIKFLNPATIDGVPEENAEKVNSGTGFGAMFSVPIFQRWDVETAIEYNTWYGRKNSHAEYKLPYSNNNSGWEEFSSYGLRRNSFSARAIGSYQFLSTKRISLHAGAGARIALQNKFNLLPGQFMGEAGVKMIYTPLPVCAVQVGAWFGKTQYGECISLRASLLLRLVRPDC